MTKFIKCFFVLGMIMCAPFTANASAMFISNAYVNVTSDTSSTAKTMAFNEARRQVIQDVLSKFADKNQLAETLKNSKDTELVNLISSSTIDSERLSDTTYSANIEMMVDQKIAKKWMNDNNINHWMGNVEMLSKDQALVSIVLGRGLADWIELNSAIRNANLMMDIKRISDGTVTAAVIKNNQMAFIGAVRNAGWNVSNSSDMIRIWK